MFSYIAGLVLLATPMCVAGTEPPSMPLKAPISPVEATSAQETILPTWRYELSLEPELEALANCESRFNEKAINHMDSDGLKAYGLFQYKEGTWLWFQELMGVSGLDIMSGEDQLLVTRWAMQNGKASHWGVCL